MVEREEEHVCPDCGSLCVRDEVDIGVGITRSPWRCNECGWSQQKEADEYLRSVGLGDDDAEA